MRVVNGDLFSDDLMSQADAVCVTTNMQVNMYGHAVMGAGVAKEAARRWPVLPMILGGWLKQSKSPETRILTKVIAAGKSLALVSLPTKLHWKDPSPLPLVLTSCRQLRELADKHGWTCVLLPPPGCGLGGLKWPDLEPQLNPLLDDRFTVVFLKR